MERLNSRYNKLIPLIFFCSLNFLHALNYAPIANAERISVLQWSAADMLPAGNRYSILRYGSFGLGAYPQRMLLPGAAVRVRVDGIPLLPLSPFGPDLDLVPAVLVDSVRYENIGEISIHTGSAESDNPETHTNFLLGQKRRFHLQTTYQKKTGDSSGILFGGTSNGIHGGDYTETNSFRNYFTKYHRVLKDGGVMFFSIRAFRDRDGLRDLKNQTHMGNRETVMTSLSTGFVEFPLTQRTSISPVVYYQSGVSRFKRYGEGKSLDDNSVGFSLTSSTRRGNTERGVTVTSDSRFIDSRLHEDSWTNNDTRISCLWRWTDNRFRYVLRGGILGSSRYGTGGIGESKLVYQMTPSIEFSVRGAVTDEVPDIGLEFYPALEFSDTTITTELDMYRIMEFESGLRLNSRILSCGLYAFRSRGKHPLFDPENILSMMAEKETYSGIRFFMTAHEDDRYHTEVTIHYTDSSNSRNIWPNPGFEMVSYSQIYRKFYRKKLDSTLFGSMRVSNWSDGPVNPDGTAFFLDGGISIRVMTLTVFYMVENITGEDMVWFDILGWQGRNSMWGIQWKLEN